MVLQGHRQRRPSVQLNPCTALRMKRRTWSLEQGPVVNKAKYSSMAEYMMGAAGLHQILGRREGKGSQGGLQKEALLESSQEGLPAAALASSAAALGPDPLQSQSSSGSRGTQGRGGKLPPLHATGQQQRTSSPELQIPSWSQAASPVALQASQPLPPGYTVIDMPDKHVSQESFLHAEDSQSLLPGSLRQ